MAKLVRVLKATLKAHGAAPVSDLAPSRCPQGCREAVADQRGDVGDVGRGQPTGEADDGLELVERRPAARAPFEMLVDTSALLLVHLAVEVGGHQADELDASEVIGPRTAIVHRCARSPPPGTAPAAREPGRGPDGAGRVHLRGQYRVLVAPPSASRPRHREGRSPPAGLAAWQRWLGALVPGRQRRRRRRQERPRRREGWPSGQAIADRLGGGTDRQGSWASPRFPARERAVRSPQAEPESGGARR
jgi:hypothetical protein